MRDRGNKPCILVRSLLDRKIVQIQFQIEQMNSFRVELEEYRTAWTNNPNPKSDPQEVCPLISSVSLDRRSN